jgi:methionyl-tRNA formyltransferase
MGKDAPEIIRKYFSDSQAVKEKNDIMLDGSYFYPPQEQDHSKASMTPLLKRDDGYLSPNSHLLDKALKNESINIINTPEVFKKCYNHNKVELPASYVVRKLNLALSPWPGIWTIVKINDKKVRLKILETAIEDNRLIIKKVQLEGKKPVEFKQLKEAYALAL